MGLTNSLTSITNVASSAVSAVGAVSSGVGALATTLSGDSWSESLRTAKLGGVPFGVEDVRTRVGRRTTVHSYPFRDTVWVEDLGMLPRQFIINGFLVEDDAVFGGGGAITQREALMKVAETAPTSDGLTLIHPTLGTLRNISIIGGIEFNERRDLGRVFEFRVTLLRGGARVFPKATTSTTTTATTSAASALAAAVSDFESAVSTVQTYASAITTAISTVSSYIAIAKEAVTDVTSIFSAVSALSGSNGRYSSGSNSGYSSSNSSTATTSATLSTEVSAALAASLVARTAVTTASDTLSTATEALASDSTAFTDAAASLITAVAATATDPADALRMVENLTDFSPDSYDTDSVLGAARSTMEIGVAAMLRRTALTQLVTSATTYQPSSSNDALTVLATITGLLDDEILVAGDAGDDATYTAFRSMRQAVYADLSTRGSQLSAIKTFSVGSPLPSLVLAQRIYQDPTRADDLVTQADPIHPAFMPSSFDALAT